MVKVLIHATVTVDGFMEDVDGGVDWMFGFESADEDMALVGKVQEEIGAIIGGSNKTQTIEDGEIPYGGMLKVPVFLLTHSAHEPVERDGITYTFVVEDMTQAVSQAKAASGGKAVALLGGSISRQCLELGLVDEIQLHMVPVLLGEGISLFSGLTRKVTLERVETEAFASETHLRFGVVR